MMIYIPLIIPGQTGLEYRHPPPGGQLPIVLHRAYPETPVPFRAKYVVDILRISGGPIMNGYFVLLISVAFAILPCAFYFFRSAMVEINYFPHMAGVCVVVHYPKPRPSFGISIFRIPAPALTRDAGNSSHGDDSKDSSESGRESTSVSTRVFPSRRLLL
jgi:hypothetical protein